MMRESRKPIAVVILLALPLFWGYAQDDTAEGGNAVESEEATDANDSLFSDPFSVGDAESEGTESSVDDFFADPFGTVSVSGDSEKATAGSEGKSDDPFHDLDSLFQEEMVDEVDDPDSIEDPELDLLSSDGVTWGGRIRAATSLEWSWNSTDQASFDLIDPTGESLNPSVTADLFVDARPDAQFRAFTKLKLVSSASQAGLDLATAIDNAALTGDLPEGWVRGEDENGDTVIRDENGDVVFTVEGDSAEEESNEPGTGSPPPIDISVYELFADYNYLERLFFRFGKHTIQWGVGYFFSPADVLNLTAIDPEDATADREGPVSLKIQFPFSINNAYLYIITNVDAKPDEIAVAPKVEFVLGNTEIAVGGHYQRALAPRLIAMATSSIDELDVFGETIVSFGSDRVFVRRSQKDVEDFEAPPDGLETVLDTYTVEHAPLMSATVGGRDT